MQTLREKLHAVVSCLCLVSFIFSTELHAEKCTTGFSVVAPEAAVPGKWIAVLVDLHQDPKEAKRPANVTLRLQSEKLDNTLICQTSKMIYGHGIISMKLPLTESGLHTLHTIVSFMENETNLTHNDLLDHETEYQSRSLLTVVGPVRDVIIRPNKQTYSPGETITFWIMALDHDLRLPKGVLGTVSLKDPSGTKVAIWDQISLDEGVKKFNIDLNGRATLGTWMVQVQCGDSSWTGAVNVSKQNNNNGFKDNDLASISGGSRSPAAEEHSVELRFAPTTKRWYKPGLSFKGKVEAVSTEKYIQVKVEIFDDTTSIYSQGVEIPQGDGSFTVPYMVSNNDVLNLQAELISVEGKEIESHYILARETIQKWNSSSKCYLVIEGLDTPLQAGSRAQVKVVSTCTCEREFHVAIVTDGRLTFWAERPTSHGSNYNSVRGSDSSVIWGNMRLEPGIVGTTHCSVHFSFLVKPDMAPSSQILVYYITADGEPVSDVNDFEVQLQHKEVALSMEQNKTWQLGDKVTVQIKAETNNLVCLIGGSATSDKFDPFNSHVHSLKSIKDEQDFLEAGVTLFQRRCPILRPHIKNGTWPSLGAGARSSVTYRPGGPRSHRRPPLLPQPTDKIWTWDCFKYTSDMSKRQVVLPNDEGVYSLWATSVGPGGLKVSAVRPIPLATPALRVTLPQPPPLTVRETLELDISISNTLDACMDVTALLSLSGGGRFLSNNMMYVTEKLRLGPRGATSLVVKIVVTNSGEHNLTAEVTGLAGGCVSHGSQIQGPQGGNVVKTIILKVRSEGLTRTDTESAYFCANEHTLISTNDKYEYEWISAPRNREVLVFEVKAGYSVRIALSDERGPTDNMYHVNIGDAGNSLVWIGRGQHGYGVHLSSGEIPDALSAGGFRTFWVSWARGTLTAGKGALPPIGTLAVWRLDSTHHVRHVGFSSPWGHQADFRVWNFNDEAGFSQVVQLALPRWAVPGTASGELLVAGGLAIPSNPIDYKHLIFYNDDTRTSPTSSLAAATAAFTPLFSLNHANITQHEAIIEKLSAEVQNLLSFKRKDNSFSDHPSMSSHLSTVYVLEVLTKIQSYFGIDPELLESIKHWIQKRQEKDGSFIPLPADVKISMLTSDADMEINNNNKKSSLNSYEELDYGIVEKWKNLSREALQVERNIEVTAETLAMLMEIGLENDKDLETIVKARTYLEKNIYNVTSSHPLAAMTYALVVTQSPLLPEALKILKNASTTEEGDFGWPHPLPRRDADWLYEEDSTRRMNPPVLTSLEDFKASLCVLSTYTALGDLQSAEPVARYLFYRTHLLDKHMELLYQAVKAFSAFSTLAYDRHRSLTVSLATAGMELTDTVELKADHPARHLHLPSLPTKVFVYATGAGCATVQGRITYSAYTPSSDNALLTLWSAVIEEIRPERSSLEELQGKLPTLNIKTCFKWKSQERSGPLKLEVSLFSGYKVVSINPVVLDEATFADLQHGSKDNFVWFAFTNISSSCPVCVTYQARSTFILSSLRPAFATIYPATRPDLAAELFFHTKPTSPLLRGIIEDDLITWFGKTENGMPNVGQDLPEICECGKICRRRIHNEVEEVIVNTTKSDLNITKEKTESKSVSNDIPIIVPSITSDLSNAIMTTVSSIKGESGDEIVTQKKLNVSSKSDNAKILLDIAKKQPYPKKQLISRKKGTLKYTYGENHDMLKKNIKVIHNVNNGSLGKVANTEIKQPVLLLTSTVTSKMITTLDNITTTSQTTPSEIIQIESTTVKNVQNESTITSEKSITLADDKNNILTPTPETVTQQISQIPKSVNHERLHPPLSPISETTLELNSEIPPLQFLSEKKDQLLVVDRNELWNLLKEAIHIEMDKNLEKQEAELNKVSKIESHNNKL